MRKKNTTTDRLFIRSFLKSVPIFKELEENQIEILSEKAIDVSYDKGDIICKKDNLAHKVYILKSGNVTEFAMDANDFTVVIIHCYYHQILNHLLYV